MELSRVVGRPYPCMTMRRNGSGGTWILANARPMCMLACPGCNALSMGFAK